MAAVSSRISSISHGTVAVGAVGQLNVIVAACRTPQDELLGLAVEHDDRIIVASICAGTLEISSIDWELSLWGEEEQPYRTMSRLDEW